MRADPSRTASELNEESLSADATPMHGHDRLKTKPALFSFFAFAGVVLAILLLF